MQIMLYAFVCSLSDSSRLRDEATAFFDNEAFPAGTFPLVLDIRKVSPASGILRVRQPNYLEVAHLTGDFIKKSLTPAKVLIMDRGHEAFWDTFRLTDSAVEEALSSKINRYAINVLLLLKHILI